MLLVVALLVTLVGTVGTSVLAAAATYCRSKSKAASLEPAVLDTCTAMVLMPVVFSRVTERGREGQLDTIASRGVSGWIRRP